MDVHDCSLESGGYMKKIKHNEMVHMLRGTHPGCSWKRTVSKKGRGVKIFEFKEEPKTRLMGFLEAWSWEPV
jgi:hypothetical protein